MLGIGVLCHLLWLEFFWEDLEPHAKYFFDDSGYWVVAVSIGNADGHKSASA